MLISYRTFFLPSSSLTDNIAGTFFHFHIGFSEVFSQNPDADQLHTGQKTDDTDRTGPAGMVAFLKYSYTDHMIPSMLKSDTPSPNPAIRCSGFTLRLVIPIDRKPYHFPAGDNASPLRS